MPSLHVTWLAVTPHATQSGQAAMEVAYLDQNMSRGVSGTIASLPPLCPRSTAALVMHLQLSKHHPPQNVIVHYQKLMIAPTPPTTHMHSMVYSGTSLYRTASWVPMESTTESPLYMCGCCHWQHIIKTSKNSLALSPILTAMLSKGRGGLTSLVKKLGAQACHVPTMPNTIHT